MRSRRRAAAIHITLYGVALAAIAFALAWLDFRRLAYGWSEQFTVLAVAVGFAAFGIWIGNQLSARSRPNSSPDVALAELGISAREHEVLSCLAQGASNKIIARQLGISPNTVKTHVARLFEKLGASNRTEAMARARDLGLVS